MVLEPTERKNLIKQIQFILFDEHDINPHLLNYRYVSGYYNSISDEDLVSYYEELKRESSSIHNNEMWILSED